MKLSAKSRAEIKKEKQLEAEKRYPQLLLRPPVSQMINFIVLTRDPFGVEWELHLNNGGLDARRGFWVEIALDDEGVGLIAPNFILKFLESKIRVKKFTSPPVCLHHGYNQNSIPISLWTVHVPWELHTNINFQYKLKTTATPIYLSWQERKRSLLKNFMALCA